MITKIANQVTIYVNISTNTDDIVKSVSQAKIDKFTNMNFNFRVAILKQLKISIFVFLIFINKAIYCEVVFGFDMQKNHTH